jgi:hypothetical protein
VGQVADLLQISAASVRRLVDAGELRGFWRPSRRPTRTIAHEALVSFLQRDPRFRHVLARLPDYDPEDSGADPEPPPPPRPRGAVAPRSAHRPRCVRGGRIPAKDSYSLSKLGFALGCSRQSVWGVWQRFATEWAIVFTSSSQWGPREYRLRYRRHGTRAEHVVRQVAVVLGDQALAAEEEPLDEPVERLALVGGLRSRYYPESELGRAADV